MMLSVLFAICIASISITALVVGFLAGRNFGRDSSLVDANVPNDKVTELRALILEFLTTGREQGRRLADKSGRLCNMASQTAAIPHPLVQALEEIRDDVRALSDTLVSFERSALPDKQPRPLAEKIGMQLTRQELITLSPEAVPDQKIDCSQTQRYQFSCTQQAAPWAPGAPFPAPADFQDVKCRDVSAGGISFLWPDSPEFEYVVMTISTTGTPIYMAAQIVHSRAVFMFGEVGYLVGCKFIKRLSVDQCLRRGRETVCESQVPPATTSSVW